MMVKIKRVLKTRVYIRYNLKSSMGPRTRKAIFDAAGQLVG